MRYLILYDLKLGRSETDGSANISTELGEHVMQQWFVNFRFNYTDNKDELGRLCTSFNIGNTLKVVASEMPQPSTHEHAALAGIPQHTVPTHLAHISVTRRLPRSILHELTLESSSHATIIVIFFDQTIVCDEVINVFAHEKTKITLQNL